MKDMKKRQRERNIKNSEILLIYLCRVSAQTTEEFKFEFLQGTSE